MADAEAENVELVNRLRTPETVREAFSEVVRRYSQQLYWQIRRLVQSHEDADDILQNTFLKAWQNIENFRGEARLSTWLHKIAINESLSHLDKLKKQELTGLDAPELSAAASAEGVDGNELMAKLRKAVLTLPQKQQLVFNMKYFDDMKYEDMSEILGTSVGALKASYHLAVKKIEQYFEDAD